MEPEDARLAAAATAEIYSIYILQRAAGRQICRQCYWRWRVRACVSDELVLGRVEEWGCPPPTNGSPQVQVCHPATVGNVYLWGKCHVLLSPYRVCEWCEIYYIELRKFVPELGM